MSCESLTFVLSCPVVSISFPFFLHPHSLVCKPFTYAPRWVFSMVNNLFQVTRWYTAYIYIELYRYLYLYASIRKCRRLPQIETLILGCHSSRIGTGSSRSTGIVEQSSIFQRKAIIFVCVFEQPDIAVPRHDEKLGKPHWWRETGWTSPFAWK